MQSRVFNWWVNLPKFMDCVLLRRCIRWADSFWLIEKSFHFIEGLNWSSLFFFVYIYWNLYWLGLLLISTYCDLNSLVTLNRSLLIRQSTAIQSFEFSGRCNPWQSGRSSLLIFSCSLFCKIGSIYHFIFDIHIFFSLLNNAVFQIIFII